MEQINFFDNSILMFVNSSLHSAFLDKIMIFFTTLGNVGLIWIIICAVLIINRKTRRVGIIALIALIFDTVMGEGIIKHLVDRPRPFIEHRGIHLMVAKPVTSSFPSGHTSSSFAVSYILSKYYRRYSYLIWTTAVFIALSRIYLFVHYPTDVIAGAFLGLACGYIVYRYTLNKTIVR